MPQKGSRNSSQSSPQRPKSSHQGSPRPRSTDNDGEREDKDRKRVCKACDRCRLKKSKCDGQNPCNRCQSDDGMCQYGQRKKMVDKVYPKGFTDQLVADFTLLSNAVQTLYSYHTDRKGEFDFPEVERRGPNNTFLLHDILASIDILKPSAKDSEDGDRQFPEDPLKLCQKFEDQQEFERRVAEAVQQQTGTPSASLRDFPMLDVQHSAPMSRSSSFTSLHHSGGGGPPLSGVPRITIPPSRHMSIPDHRHSFQSQYMMNSNSGPHPHGTIGGGLMPPTPTESPSEEGFPAGISYHQSLTDYAAKSGKSPYGGGPPFSAGPLAPNQTHTNINTWMSRVQSPFGPPHHQQQQQQHSSPHQGRPASMSMARGPMMMHNMPPTLVTTASEAVFSPSSLVVDDSMLTGTPGSATRFTDDPMAAPWKDSAMQFGNDPDMGFVGGEEEFGFDLS